MSWIAVTDQGQIGAGTVLGIFEEPWGPNLPVNPLPSGAGPRHPVAQWRDG